MDLWLKENTVPQNESVPLDRERVIVENAVPLDENEQRRERFREEGEQYLIRVEQLEQNEEAEREFRLRLQKELADRDPFPLVECNYCDLPVAKTARTCPHCGAVLLTLKDDAAMVGQKLKCKLNAATAKAKAATAKARAAQTRVNDNVGERIKCMQPTSGFEYIGVYVLMVFFVLPFVGLFLLMVFSAICTALLQ